VPALTPARAAAPQGLAIVMNSAAASFSVIDVASRQVIRTTPVLREPHHWALLPDRSALLIGDTSGNTLFFVDPVTGEVKRRAPISDPYQLWFSPDGQYLVVAALGVNHVDVYDGATLAHAHRFRLPTMPSHLSYAPDGGMVYVSLQASNELVAIDLRTMSVVWKSAIGKTPAGVFWHDGRVLVGVMGGDHVAVADPKDGRVIRRVRTGRGAHNLFYAPDGRTIFVTNRVEGTISVLDAGSLNVLRSYAVPNGPDCIAFAPDGTFWVSMRWGGHVAVVDPASGTHETIAVGRSPHGVFLTASPALPGPSRAGALSLSTA
jgi:YVTN family beta-propeller protein